MDRRQICLIAIIPVTTPDPATRKELPMQFFRKEMWSYAVLLIVLFCIETIAVWHTINYLGEQIPDDQYAIAALLIWILTLGFMLIAGAFGLWAIQFSAEAESQRRIGHLVSTMDYLSDGLIVVDKKGRITGANPAGSKITSTDTESLLGTHVGSVFPCLSHEDIELLLSKKRPNEVEREHQNYGTPVTLRFRSQSSGNLSLILISDITGMTQLRAHNRQVARLQLIGHLARGVAHDFNNLLCGISGHASLLARLQHTESEDFNKSIDSITRHADKGIALAGHLLELSNAGTSSRNTSHASDHVSDAVDMLHNSIPKNTQVTLESSRALPPVALTGIQIEQTVMNLAMVIAETTTDSAGTITIRVSPPNPQETILDIGSNYAGVIIIAYREDSIDNDAASNSSFTASSREPGIIESIIISTLTATGGKLDILAAPNNMPVYRICLPFGTDSKPQGETPELADELKAYISNWSVLIARSAQNHSDLDSKLSGMNAKVDFANDVMSTLARVDDEEPLDAMVIDLRILGRESKALLRAIIKLRPTAGIVVIDTNSGEALQSLHSDIFFVSNNNEANAILHALIQAKSLAAKR